VADRALRRASDCEAVLDFLLSSFFFFLLFFQKPASESLSSLRNTPACRRAYES